MAGNLSGGNVLQVLTNPTSLLNPTGIPTTGDLIQAIVERPDQLYRLVENPTQILNLPVQSGMVAGRNAVLANGARPIPSHVRAALRGFYSDSLMDSVRWSTNWSAIQNTPEALQMMRDHTTKAITLVNVVLFRDSTGADDIALWAHELHHVKQYADWGVLVFADRWTRNSTPSGEVEAPAYAVERQIREIFEDRGEPTRVPIPDSADCTNVNATVAFCNLYAANGPGFVQFTVKGTARASSNGTNRGRMSLVMLTNGQRCNAKADQVAGVDNDTQLEGEGYSCFVQLGGGQMQRIYLVQPNDIADGVFTRAAVTWTRSSRPVR